MQRFKIKIKIMQRFSIAKGSKRGMSLEENTQKILQS